MHKISTCRVHLLQNTASAYLRRSHPFLKNAYAEVEYWNVRDTFFYEGELSGHDQKSIEEYSRRKCVGVQMSLEYFMYDIK